MASGAILPKQLTAGTRKLVRPYIVNPHGMLDPGPSRTRGGRRGLPHSSTKTHTCVMRPASERSAKSEARSIRAYGLPNPICVIPNGIDLPPVVDGPELRVDGPLSRTKKGAKGAAVSGANPSQEGLGESDSGRCRGARGKADEWILAIAGWDQGGHEGELKRLASELGIKWAEIRSQKSEVSYPTAAPRSPISVAFLGPQFGEDKAACYRGCDAFILPSFSEGLPMTVLEAWSYGKAVLMTPECNLPKVLLSVRLFASQLTCRPFRKHSSICCSPSSTLHSMGDKGHALVASRFAWPEIGQEVRAVCEWVLGRGPKPDSVRLN